MSDPAGTAGAVQYYVNSSTFGGDKDKLFLDTSNVRLGIGTDAPLQKIHIQDTTGDVILAVDADSGSGDSILALRNSVRIWNVGMDHSDDDKLVIAVGGDWNNIGVTGRDVMTMTYGGRVGIGTSAPDTMLDLAQGGAITLRGNQNAIQFRDASDNLDFLVGQRSDIVADDFVFHSYGGDWAFSSGNVGIGTTSPTNKLSVVDNSIGKAVSANFGPTTIDGSTREGGIQLHGSAGSADKTWGIWNDADPILLRFEYLGTRGTAFDAGTDVLTLDYSGKVGIGTTAPGATLGVVGAIHSFGTGVTPSATSGFQLAANNSDDNGYLWNFENADIVFATNNAEKVRITAVGEVGIGTTSPGEKLHLVTAGNTRIRIDSGDSSASSVDLYDNGSLGVRVNCDSSKNLELMAGGRTGADLIVLASNGNVGIGTSSPGAELDVHGTGTVAQLESSSSQVLLQFKNSGSGAYEGIGSNGTRMSLYTANAERVSIMADGKVGIGTTAPGDILEAAGAGRSMGSTNRSVAKFESTTSNKGGVMLGGTSYGVNDSALIFPSVSTGSLILNVGLNGDTLGMAIQSNGNIGIGTVTPTNKLDVEGNIGVKSGKVVRFYDSGNSNYSTIDSPASGAIAFSTGGVADAAYITNAGNVGIGTAAPAEKLDVDGHIRIRGNNRSLYFDGDQALFKTTSSGTDFKFQNSAATTNVTFKDSGDAAFNGSRLDLQNASGTHMSVVSTGSVASFTVQAGEANTASITISSDDGDDASDITLLEQSNGGPFKIKTNNGGSTAISCDSGGNVAIKQASASYALDVNGVVNCSSLRFADGTSISTTPTGTVLLRDLNPAAFNYDLHVAGSVGIGTTTPNGKLSVRETATDTECYVEVRTAANGGGDPYIKFDAGGTNFIVGEKWVGTTNNYLVLGPGENPDITSGIFVKGDGNVGIGTTGPVRKLHIAGTAGDGRIRISNSGAESSTVIDLENDDASTEMGIYASAADAFQIWHGTSASAVARLTIQTGGNVGIGTTSPAGKLHIEQSSTTEPALRIVDSGVASYDFLFPATDTLRLQCDTTSTKKFTLTNEGTGQFDFVLFGGRMMLSGYSSNPLSKIHIREAANLDNNFRSPRNGDTAIRFDIPNYTNNIIIPMLEAAHSANDSLPPATRIASKMTGNGSLLLFGTTSSYSGGINNTALTISPVGRIGINTETPGCNLDIYRSDLNTTNEVHLRRSDLPSTYCEWSYNSGTSIFGTVSSDHLSLKTNGAHRIYIHGSSGNVGIATTSPSYTLDVDGTIRCNTLLFKDGTSFSSVGQVGNKAIAVNIGNGSSNVAGRAKSVVDASYGGIQNGLVLVYYYYHYHSRCGNGGCTRTAYAKQAYQVTDGNWSGVFGF